MTASLPGADSVTEIAPTGPSFIPSPTELSTVTPFSVPTLRLEPSTVSPTIPSQSLPLPKFPLDGYVMLFKRDGTLYFQDGNISPVKLVEIGQDVRDYRFSDDNRKVIVYDPYSYAYDNFTFSINTDGTQRRRILPVGWPDQNLLWGTQLGVVEFITGTHRLIFSTHSCSSFDHPITCVSSLFLADTDTGDIKKLADLGYSGPANHENFVVSPNGKMVAVGSSGTTDILSMDGKIIRHDILPFKPSTADVYFPSISWLPDSSGLIAALPNKLGNSHADNYISASSIWRYSINSNSARQIMLDPAPMSYTYKISPDGNWVVYGGLGYEPSVYIGNLADGTTKIVGEIHQAQFTWGPDSRHFIVSSGGYVLGSIDKTFFYDTCQPEHWVDLHHFTCLYTDGRIRMAEIDAVGAIKIYDLGFDQAIEYSVFMKPK
jgi:hypothetical protein